MNDPVVTVAQGQLKGIICRSVLGPTYLAFKGIPFATPPIGELRFKDPQPPIPWSGIRDASINHGVSPQFVPYHDTGFIGTEDCLYLNVFAPSLTGRRPVMVWIHGGSFLMGSGYDSYKRPDYLITRDIILVTLNYRLGVFGFLNLGHKAAPGNQGLKDVILALEWVKENISNFGGDSDNITIFGDSAGGTMIQCLVVSPAVKGRGLFHKAISQSGLQNMHWSKNAGASTYSFKLASALGAKSKNPGEIVKFLQTLPCEKMVRAQLTLVTPAERSLFILPFGCVTDDVAETPVLPLPIDELLKNDSDIPYIIGTTSHEFLMFVPSSHEVYLKKIEESLVKHFEIGWNLDRSDNLQRLVVKAKKLFLKAKMGSKENLPGLIEFFTQLYFTDYVKSFLESRRKQKCAPTYMYRYSYYGKEMCTSDLFVERVIPGASHVDETCYLFYTPACKKDNPDPPAEGTKDRLTLERMTRMWTNFAKTGNPTSELDEFVDVIWEPASEESNSYLNIGDDLNMKPSEPCLRELLK